MDGDLQNDPADIPRLLEIARDYDIVCGWRKDRKDDFLTRHVPSVVANWLLGLATGIRLHDNGCSLKVFRAEVVKPLKLSPGMHRYLPALASQLGGRVTEVVVNHRPRRFGRIEIRPVTHVRGRPRHPAASYPDAAGDRSRPARTAPVRSAPGARALIYNRRHRRP